MDSLWSSLNALTGSSLWSVLLVLGVGAVLLPLAAKTALRLVPLLLKGVVTVPVAAIGSVAGRRLFAVGAMGAGATALTVSPVGTMELSLIGGPSNYPAWAPYALVGANAMLLAGVWMALVAVVKGFGNLFVDFLGTRAFGVTGLLTVAAGVLGYMWTTDVGIRNTLLPTNTAAVGFWVALGILATNSIANLMIPRDFQKEWKRIPLEMALLFSILMPGVFLSFPLALDYIPKEWELTRNGAGLMGTCASILGMVLWLRARDEEPC